MVVTRDADFDTEIASLFQALNHCCEGYNADAVLQASVNLVIAAINYAEQLHDDGSRAMAVASAEQIAAQLPTMVGRQWDRRTSPSDVVVPHKGN